MKTLRLGSIFLLRNSSGTLSCRGSRLHFGSKHWATHTGQTPVLLIHSGILFYPHLTPSPGPEAVAFCQKPLAKSRRRVGVSSFSTWLWRLMNEEWLLKRDPKKRGCRGPKPCFFWGLCRAFSESSQLGGILLRCSPGARRSSGRCAPTTDSQLHPLSS